MWNNAAAAAAAVEHVLLVFDVWNNYVLVEQHKPVEALAGLRVAFGDALELARAVVAWGPYLHDS